MNPYVASPHWGGWIVAYFYLGGVAAGSYAVSAMVGLWGGEDDRRAARVADYLAFPLVGLCGLILIVDLNRPERFWHMLVQSETYRPMLKWWSPMSIGSWGLSAFSALSFGSFLGALAEDGRFGLGRWSALASRLRRGMTGRLFGLAGAGAAFFLGAYTGTLLSATNQPVWADTAWLSALFLASSLATGVAAVILLVRWRLRDTPPEVLERFERVDAWAAVMELVLIAAFLVSLGRLAGPALLQWPGALVPAVVIPAGTLFPLAARTARGDGWRVASAVSVLAAGLVLRYAIVGIPETLILGS